MNKSHFLILACMALVSVSAQAGRPFNLPANATQIARDIYDLGTGMHDGEQIRGYAFIHRKDEAARPSNPGGGNKKDNTSGSTCYTFIGNGAKWKTAEDYIIDSTNLSGMSQSYVENGITTATGLWENEVPGVNIFGNHVAGTVDGADTSTPLDDKNEIYFADIIDPAIDSNNTIAVTVVWGVFTGPTRNRRLVEWDQVYNEAFTFGDASSNTGIMDFLGIAAHEVGHAIQDHTGYKPLITRTRMIATARKIERFGAVLMMGVPLLAALTRAPSVGVLMFLAGFATLCIPVLVHLLTLPTEFDASFKRALPMLASGAYIPPEDIPAAKKILLACALTYVSNSLIGLLNVWRWIRLLRR